MDDSGRNIEECRWDTKMRTSETEFFLRYKRLKWGTAGNPDDNHTCKNFFHLKKIARFIDF